MGTEKQRQVWTPIEFSEKWLEAATAKFDDLAPSWYKRRETLAKEDEDYKEFLERLKREHAIETGIVEKLYDLSDGITQTFIKEGFVEAYIGHDDTNITPKQLMGYLNDHFKALDFVFTFVQSNRELTKGFIKELHALLTQHQKTTLAVNGHGRTTHIELIKGEFKKHPNNPRREDGTLCLYCPPEQTESEMERLLALYKERMAAETSPIIVSTWFHHAFTQIHPFQDGNGRMARLLSSLIWIKSELFPLTVKRTEKSTYIKALEKADVGDPNPLVTFFSEVQIRNIDSFLNYRKEIEPQDSLAEVAAVFAEKVNGLKLKREQQRQKLLSDNRQKLFDSIYETFGNLNNELTKAFRGEDVEIQLKSVGPDDEKSHWYTKQIVDYAKTHNYYFNKLLPRCWFRFIFLITEDKRYDLIVTIHHSSYDDSVMAVGSFLEFFDEKVIDGAEHLDYAGSTPIDIPPYKISVETITPKLLVNIENYIRDIVKTGMAVITNEIE
ncbi:MAG: Fic family protein [Sedimentisphaerales bacterium]|nr:Fic family protein [Sedimentisphaerales bacterium]